MKPKKNARDRRAQEAAERKSHWNASTARTAMPAVRKSSALVPEEETSPALDALSFLEYLDQEDVIDKDELEPVKRKTARRVLIGVLNLEEGMPTVEEAIDRMDHGLQAMHSSGMKLVRLIHGYGSTGRGGKICVGARKELEKMKSRRRIRGYVTGEEFGPCSDESRKLADQFPEIVRDQDYGRCNHGITMVIL